MKKSLLAFFLCFSMLLTGFGVIAVEGEPEITEAVEQQALTAAPSLLKELEGMTAEEFAQVPLINGSAADEGETPGTAPAIMRANRPNVSQRTWAPMVVNNGSQAAYLSADGQVYTWGSALISGDIDKPAPTLVEGLDSVIKIAAGSSYFLALRADGTVWGWGSAYYGIVGSANTTEPVQINGLSNIVDIAAGLNHCLALTSAGFIYAWGSNYNKQLGIDSPLTVSSPIQVSALQSVIGITAGEKHSVAVTSGGTVWAWGDNTYGQLGNGTTTNQTSPIQVTGLPSIAQISSGRYASTAIDTEGQIWLWGRNTSGGLGTGDTTNQTSPVCISEIGHVLSAANGEDTTIVLKDDGSLWAVGSNTKNLLGDGKRKFSATPQRVLSIENIQEAVTGGTHVLVKREDGMIWAYGDNSHGQLGTTSVPSSSIPIQVNDVDGTPLTDVVQISANGSSSYILREDGTVWAWGSNGSGQLGNGTTENSNAPVQVKAENGEGHLTDVVKVVANYETCFAIKRDGTVWGWGYDPVRLFTPGGVAPYSSTPIQIPVTDAIDATTNGLDLLVLKSDGTLWGKGDDLFGQVYTATQATNVDQISLGMYHSIFLKTDGSVWGCGKNDDYALGLGNNTFRFYEPQQILRSEEGVIAIDAASYHTLALKSDGTLLSWGGYNSNGELGNGSPAPYTTPGVVVGPNGIDKLSNIRAISSSNSHSIAIDNDGIAWTWGSNSAGQLGDGVSVPYSLDWVRVQTPTSGSVASANGTYHTAILNSDGTVWTAGRNQYGQLGIGTNTDSAEAVQITGLDAVSTLVAGDNHTLALKNDGTVWAWGKNTYGQLGNQSSTNASAPVQVLDDNGDAYLEGVVAIAANADYSLALKADGSLWGWGLNDQGQLGDGTVNSHNLPVQVKGTGRTGYLTDVVGMAAGEKHALVVKSDGTVWAWGDNQYWQLGDHSDMESFTPVQVTGSGGTGTLTDVVAVTAGRDASYALKADGTVWAWGYNAFGQIGDGSTTHAEAPVQVKGENGTGYLTGVAELSANLATVYAKKSDGTVWGWGNNEFGEFGIDTSNNRTTIPVRAFTKYILYDDYGNDFAEATEVFVNKTVTGEINYASDVDCFKFTVPFADGYLLKSTGIIVPTVYNESYEPICAMGPTAFNLMPNKEDFNIKGGQIFA